MKGSVCSLLLTSLISGCCREAFGSASQEEVCSSPSVDECSPESFDANDDGETEFMKVTLLQTSLSVGSRKYLAEQSDPVQGNGRLRISLGASGLTEAQADLGASKDGSFAETQAVPVASEAPSSISLGASGLAEAHADSSASKASSLAEMQAEPVASKAPSASSEPALLGEAVSDPDSEMAGAAAMSMLQSSLEVHAETERPAERCGVLDTIGYPGLAPLHFELQMDTLRATDALPARSPCRDSTKPRVALLQSRSEKISVHALNEWSIISAYVAFYIVCMSCMMYYMTNPPSKLYKAVEYVAPRCKRVSNIDVEEETWRESMLGWLAVSWASPWVARWGHSHNAALTKIKAHELPQMGSKELQARESAKDFDQLWNEEIKNRGEAGASLLRVMIKLYSVKSMLCLMCVLGLKIVISQLYSVFLIQQALMYFHYLQEYQQQHGTLPDLRAPIGLTIVVFSALPFSNILLSSVENSISCRLDQKLCGGLCMALFRKAQRLPSPSFQDNIPHEDAGKQADLMTLINYDVNANLQGCYLQLCNCVNSTLSVIILMMLLWSRLKMATLCALAVAVPVVFLSLVMTAGMGDAMGRLQSAMDKRIQALREVLFGIRVVKSYAWEEAMEAKIGEMRREEMRNLRRYYHYLGAFMGIFLSFPRILILSGVWGYSAIYGHQDVATIFTCMQILSSLKGNCDLFTRCLGKAIILSPTVQRIENFLKAPEAPVLLPETKPDWVDLWPDLNMEADPEIPLLRSRPENQPPDSLQIKGSFKWHPEGVPVLHDLDMTVPRGKLVGVVGSVGSGKSTLVQAVLGELYPDLSKECKVSRPTVVAYCSQVPHIAEGTLKENVLFGQPLDEERYNAAIKAASLEADLKVLPGGDSVPIGGRGITLSGGQKARVQMARAAYHKDDMVIVDDPFGAVDAPTAMVLLDKLLLGPLMQDRTRLVILQPDAERIAKFDHVVVLSGGRMVEQGTPAEVMQTEAYKSLLQTTTTEEYAANDEPGPKPKEESQKSSEIKSKDSQANPAALRDEESEGRPSWEMIKHYCRMGKWRNIFNTCILFFVQIYVYLLCDLVLARWTNTMSLDPGIHDKPYLLGYLFWLAMGTLVWVVCWKYGEWFTLGISAQVHGYVLHKILRAPIDRFFDKHPVGRIMNRMSADMSVVDLFLFMRSTGTIAIIYQTLIPLCYIHTIMPLSITALAIPLYYLIWNFCLRYWNTSVPLRYCMSSARSDVNSLISDVVNNNVVIRAYKDQERITMEMSDAIDNQLKALLIGDRVLRRWLVNRIVFMWSFYTTSMYIIGILNTGTIGAGTLGLCLTNLLLLESLIEPNLDSATGAQFEFIALARIHEYINIPQEKDMRPKGDIRYRSFSARLQRKGLGKLTYSVTDEGAVKVLRNGSVLLQSTACGTALMPASECISGKGAAAQLKDLDPSNKELADAVSWHRIVSVNDVLRDAKAMATELCNHKMTALSFSGNAQVVLGVQSGWLFDGARVNVENIKAGYADIPRDVLKGITLEFKPKEKVGIVGTTGCGKSSLLLVLLRVLEPRAGRVLINGADTRDMGLATLRSSMGLVPQDPVLFSGTIRSNLDPFRQYTDGRMLAALKIAGMGALIEQWPAKLDHQISDEGTNLSFGQRQLVCLARMVLRQPAVLLLDEATSAIDPKTQEQVQDTINSAFPGTTMIAVAHRLETILDFDQVVVLDKGCVAEQGPVKELAELKDGIFRKMLASKRSW